MGGAADLNGRGLSVRARARPPREAALRASTVRDAGGLWPLAPVPSQLAPSSPSLLGRLGARAAELQESLVAYVLGVEPSTGFDGIDAQLEEGRREMIAACIACGLASIEQGASWSGTIPPAVAEHARRAAAAGMSLATALHRCLAAFGLAWRLVLGEVARHDLPDEQKLALLLQTWTAIESLHARVQAEIAEAHSCEIARRARSLEQRRAEIVHRLLAGGSPDTDEHAVLGYELDAWHVCVIATGPDAGKAVRCLQSGLGCELLPVSCGAQTVLAWLGARRKLAFEDIERTFSVQGEDMDASLAVGEHARGLAGWRTTYREAEGAALVARYWPRRITRYADVALDVAVLQDEGLADSLIERYLSSLDDIAIGGQAARQTLRALFDAEYDVSSAAHALKAHRSTVHRWREEIESRLGYPLHEHQAEIELALRVEELRKRRDAARPDLTG
jgi:hypothetical protein